ncbi:unnamed protein product, partial [Rotaria magnacalcarata]
DLVRKLKAEKAPAEQIKEAVAKLMSLKQELAAHHLAVNGEATTTGGNKLLQCPRVNF